MGLNLPHLNDFSWANRSDWGLSKIHVPQLQLLVPGICIAQAVRYFYPLFYVHSIHV